MSKSVVVLSVPHELQGPQFPRHVNDPASSHLVEGLIKGGISVEGFATGRIDFVFEEAAGRRPSIAEDLAKSLLGPGHYLDVDPPPHERRKHGIKLETGGYWFDPSLGAHYRWEEVDEHRKREQLWLQAVQAQAFETGLAICGLGHGLSFPFRLLSAGVRVLLTFNHIPYDKLCSHA